MSSETQPKKGTLIPYQEVIQGVLYDHRGMAFTLFTRRRDSVIPVTCLMAQTPEKTVLTIVNVATKGIVFRKLVITLRDASGRSLQLVAKDIRDAYEESVAKSLAMVGVHNKLFGGHHYTPDDFWMPLSEGKMAEAMGFTKR